MASFKLYAEVQKKATVLFLSSSNRSVLTRRPDCAMLSFINFFSEEKTKTKNKADCYI